MPHPAPAHGPVRSRLSSRRSLPTGLQLEPRLAHSRIMGINDALEALRGRELEHLAVRGQHLAPTGSSGRARAIAIRSRNRARPLEAGYPDHVGCDTSRLHGQEVGLYYSGVNANDLELTERPGDKPRPLPSTCGTPDRSLCAGAGIRYS